ncbi:MAG: hypothetical protein AAGG81_00040 [Chlamydiota bacterium]
MDNENIFVKEHCDLVIKALDKAFMLDDYSAEEKDILNNAISLLPYMVGLGLHTELDLKHKDDLITEGKMQLKSADEHREAIEKSYKEQIEWMQRDMDAAYRDVTRLIEENKTLKEELASANRSQRQGDAEKRKDDEIRGLQIRLKQLEEVYEIAESNIAQYNKEFEDQSKEHLELLSEYREVCRRLEKYEKLGPPRRLEKPKEEPKEEGRKIFGIDLSNIKIVPPLKFKK